MRKFLDDKGIGAGQVWLKEGSGLAPACRVTPAAVVTLLTAMSRTKDGALYADCLPQAGVDGTLSARFKGTAAEKRLWAKTGSMDMVSALSGYAVTLANEHLVFCIMLNGFKDPAGSHSAREEVDGLARLIVETPER